MRHLRTDIKEQGFQLLEGFFAASDHHRELALLKRDDAAGNWSVDHIRALLANFGGESAASFGTHRAHVDVELACAETLQQSVRAVGYSREGSGIGHHGKDD